MEKKSFLTFPKIMGSLQNIIRVRYCFFVIWSNTCENGKSSGNNGSVAFLMMFKMVSHERYNDIQETRKGSMHILIFWTSLKQVSKGSEKGFFEADNNQDGLHRRSNFGPKFKL